MGDGADNVAGDGAAQGLLDELLPLGQTWIEHVLAGVELKLLPLLLEKNANGFHEWRFVPGLGVVPYQATRTASTMRVGVTADEGGWLMRATQELRKPGDSPARTELQQRVESIMNSVQVDRELWSTTADGQPLHEIVEAPAGKTLYKKLDVRLTMACPPAAQEQQLQLQDVDPTSQEIVQMDGAALRAACAFEATIDFFYGATCLDLGVAVGKEPGRVVQRFVLRDGNGNRLTAVDTPPFVVVSNKTNKDERSAPYDIALCAAVGTGSAASDGEASGGVVTPPGYASSSSAGSSMQVEEEEDEKMRLAVAIFQAEIKDLAVDLAPALSKLPPELQLPSTEEVLALFDTYWRREATDSQPEKRQRTSQFAQSPARSPESEPDQGSASATTPQTALAFRSCGSDDGMMAVDSSPSLYRGLSAGGDEVTPKPLLDAEQVRDRGIQAGATKPAAPLDKFRAAAAAVQAMQKLQALVVRVVLNKQATPADCAQLVELRQACVVHELVQG